MNKLNLKIIAMDGVVFDDEVVSFIAPAKDGRIEVYAKHTPLISVLDSGALVVKSENGTKTEFKISEGVLEVRYGSKALALVDRAEKIS